MSARIARGAPARGRAKPRGRTGSSTTPSESIRLNCWLFCQIATGWRSTMSITNVSGSRRDTRASRIQPNRISRARVAERSTSGIAIES